MKNIKWNGFKSKTKINLNENHQSHRTSAVHQHQSNMASFATTNDDILINYSNLIKHLNYVDSSKFNLNDINCASSPMHSRILLGTKDQNIKRFDMKVGLAGSI